jgi:hypothetical protein
VHDLRHASAEEAENHLSEIRHAYSHQMLDIERGETFAAALSLLPDGASRLHLDVDMVAADAVSYRILLADLVRFYNAESPAPLALTYRDTLGLIATDKAERAQQAAQAWQDRLATLPGAPVLPEQLNADPQAPTPQVTRHHICGDDRRRPTGRSDRPLERQRSLFAQRADVRPPGQPSRH